jgi:hypothetical protein
VPSPPTTAKAVTDVPAVAAKVTLTSKFLSFVSSTFWFVWNIFFRDVVSLDHPVLKNLAAAVLYILRGFEVLFAAFFILMFVAWLRKKRSGGAAEPEVAVGAPAAPVEVLFDDGVVDEKDLLKGESRLKGPRRGIMRDFVGFVHHHIFRLRRLGTCHSSVQFHHPFFFFFFVQK